MYKVSFLIDSDAMIKLMKASALQTFAENFECFITKEIEEEVVTAGKIKLQADARQIEELIQAKCISVIESNRTRKGERSIYWLYRQTKNAVIISDDKKFANKLVDENVEIITSADCLRLLVSHGFMQAKDALQKLDNMKPLITKKAHETTRIKIGEQNDDHCPTNTH
jgi:rRNA-processing protein FCF1